MSVLGLGVGGMAIQSSMRDPRSLVPAMGARNLPQLGYRTIDPSSSPPKIEGGRADGLGRSEADTDHMLPPATEKKQPNFFSLQRPVNFGQGCAGLDPFFSLQPSHQPRKKKGGREPPQTGGKQRSCRAQTDEGRSPLTKKSSPAPGKRETRRKKQRREGGREGG